MCHSGLLNLYIEHNRSQQSSSPSTACFGCYMLSGIGVASTCPGGTACDAHGCSKVYAFGCIWWFLLKWASPKDGWSTIPNGQLDDLGGPLLRKRHRRVTNGQWLMLMVDPRGQ